MSVIALPADLDSDQAAALLPQLRRQIAGGGTGAVVLECRRLALASQRTLEVQHLPAGLQSMAHVYGVDGVLGVPVGASAGADPLV